MSESSTTGRNSWSRRRLLVATGGAGAGLLLCLSPAGHVLRAEDQDSDRFRFSAFLEITPAGVVRITVPTTEIGQGVHSALPRIVAEELEADWNDVEVVMPHADPGLVAEATGRHRTAASESVKVYFEQLRTVGASAREMLCHAAAAEWGVPVAECYAAKSQVRHKSSDRRASFGDLAAQASRQRIPERPTKKDPANFTLIGHSIPRKDIQDKVTGRTVFGTDVQQPGMLHAAVRMPTQTSGRVLRFDSDSISSMSGIIKVVEVQGGVAVIADSFWRAKRAAEAMAVEFEAGQVDGVDTPTMRETLSTLLDDDAGAVQFPDMDTQNLASGFIPLDRKVMESALAEADRVLELEYEVPYLAHLAMEPMVCTALVTETRCHVWAPTQHPDGGRQRIAELTGMALDDVRLDVTFTGGGFGRKFELDTITQCVQAAMAVPGRAVKLLWTREQDVQHDFYRPGFAVRSRVALKGGRLTGMHSRIAGQSVWRFQGKDQIPYTADPTAAALLIYDVYDFPGKYIDFVEAPWRIPVGLWRSVTLSQNAFFAESAIDEAAVALSRDPYEFRRELLSAHPRIVKVLDTAAQKADWYGKRSEGSGVGIALSQGFGSLCAQVAEVAVQDNRITIKQLVCVLDCGLQVDPETIRAQLEGGMVFGLSAALRGEITFEAGAVQESNFDNQPILRFDEVPKMKTVLIASDAPPGGVGEAGVPPVAPALTNAIFAATGRRLRRLPLARAGIKLG